MPKLAHQTIPNTSQNSNNTKNEPFISFQSIIISYLTVNLISSLFNGINDCDESFNYWEPLHHFLFPKDDSFKTWEYDGEYALRSWFYLFLHSVPVYVHSHLLKVSKPILFQFIRVGLAVITSISQFSCFKSINNKFGPNISKLFFFFSCFSAGNFIASTAFIPSSFCMVLSYAMLSLWLQKSTINGAVYCIAFGTLVAWPFYGAVGVPLALDILVRRREIKKFIYWCFEALLFILPGALLADFYFYGSLTFSTINIVIYNIFSGKGPDLYGTEPVSYYLKNLFLNFNFIFIFSVFSLPVTILVEMYFQKRLGSDKYKGTAAVTVFSFYLAPLYLWLGIFFSQPHKEERFLFPIYPFISFSAAVFISSVQKIYKLLSDEKIVPFPGNRSVKFPRHENIAHFCIWLTTSINISRILAQVFGFIGVLNLYSNSLQQLTLKLPEAENLEQKYSLCLGKEWHRFGTHFLVPDDKFSVKLIKSEFLGQLPGRFIGSWPLSINYDILSSYQDKNGRVDSVTRQKFNDDNLEEPDRYFDHNYCDFIIDKEGDFVPTTDLEPKYSQWKSKTSGRTFKTIYQHKIINLENSPWYSKSFYLPYFYETCNRFDDYVILMAEEEQDVE